jgi:hypothetical protein
MANSQSPGVTVEEGRIGVPRVDTTQITKTGFIGVAERGPVGVATELTSFEDYRRVFGGFLADSQLPTAVQAYFGEGGQFAYVVRVVHYTDVLDPASKTSETAVLELETATSAPSSAQVTSVAAAPFVLEDGDTLPVNVNASGVQTATINAEPAILTSNATEPFTLANNQTLLITVAGVNGGAAQTVTFLTGEFPVGDPITAALAVDVAAVINEKCSGIRAYDDAGAVVIESDRRGTSAAIDVTGGSAATELDFPGPAATGSGNVANVEAVTAEELETIIEAAITTPAMSVTILGDGRVRFASLTTGGSSSLQFSSSGIQEALGLPLPTTSGSTGAPVATIEVSGRWDGSYANLIEAVIATASNGDTERFNLSLLVDGLAVSGESFEDLSMDSADDRYIEKIVNADPLRGGSRLCVLSDLEAAGASRRPGNGTFGPLTGGDDGLVGFVDADLLGGTSDDGATGLRVLDEVPDANILVVPGESSAVMANGLVDYCEFTRLGRSFAVLSTPAALTAQGMRTYVRTTASLRDLTTRAAIYWPQIKISNPDRAIYGTADSIVVDPAGHIAGMYARNDAAQAGGIYRAPAGRTRGVLRTAVGLDSTEQRVEAKRNLLNQDFINVLRTPDRGGRIYADGSHVLEQSTEVNRVGTRRGLIFISEQLRVGLEPSLHEPNTEELRQGIGRATEDFLLVQMANGAFRSKQQNEAFVVDVSEAINPPESVDAGNVIVQIGLAMVRVTEFIKITIFPDRRALDVVGAGA